MFSFEVWNSLDFLRNLYTDSPSLFSGKVYAGQPIDRTALQQDPQVQAILTRFKNAERAEDKDKVLNDLKKMPHLFAAFIKMTSNERSSGDVSSRISK